MSNGPSQFRKKPVLITAIQWDGNNLAKIIEFTDGRFPDTRSDFASMKWGDYCDLVARDGLKIFTLEGKMSADIGDWIIKGVKGEHYPCKPEIFAMTYEAVATPSAVIASPTEQDQAQQSGNMRPVAAPVSQLDAFYEVARPVVISALLEHRMVRMFEVEEDGLGNSYPLVDRLTLDGGADIESGMVEIEAIADAVLDALAAQTSSGACAGCSPTNRISALIDERQAPAKQAKLDDFVAAAQPVAVAPDLASLHAYSRGARPGIGKPRELFYLAEDVERLLAPTPAPERRTEMLDVLLSTTPAPGETK